MKTMKLAPSILSADYANFESELKRLKQLELTMPISMSWMAILCLISALELVS